LHSYPNTTRMLHSRSSRIPKSADQVSKEERHLARLSVRSWTTSLTTADCVTNITRPCYKLFFMSCDENQGLVPRFDSRRWIRTLDQNVSRYEH
jgi:hypothetical protein